MKPQKPPRPPRTGRVSYIVCHCQDAECPDCAAWWEHEDSEDFHKAAK